MQISNSLIKLCTANLEAYATSQVRDQDTFWALLSEAVHSEVHNPQQSSSSQTPAKGQHKLIVTLNSCLELSTKFREFVQQLKDSFLQQSHSSYPAGGLTNIHRGSNTSTGSSTNNNRLSLSRGPTLRQISESGTSSKTVSATPAVGVALCDVDQITNELGEFSARVANVLDIIATLAQFRQLNLQGKLEGLPRVAGLWEIPVPTGGDEEYFSGTMSHGRSLATSKRETPDLQRITEAESQIGSESDITLDTPDFLEQMMMKQTTLSQYEGGRTSRPLSILKEESMVGSLKSSSVTSRANGKGALICI